MLIYVSAIEAEFSALSTADDTLIKRIADGDMEAFRQLYESVSGSIYGFALSITKNAHDAEDVLQDTFLTVHRSASGYQPMGKPIAWILTIARNHALMRLRSSGKTVGYDELQLQNKEALAQIEPVENRILIMELMTTLDSEERQIVMLHAASGLKNREIADLLELPLNTVLSKYHRAIKKLRIKAKEEGLSP